jgi:hypothetical protein
MIDMAAAYKVLPRTAFDTEHTRSKQNRALTDIEAKIEQFGLE